MKQSYEIIVIGGGHAGTEASHISAVLGADTLLITNDAVSYTHLTLPTNREV